MESVHRIRVARGDGGEQEHSSMEGDLRIGVNSAGIALGWFRPTETRR
jgi:hypothetical protein